MSGPLPSLEAVYNKWENKCNPYRASASSKTHSTTNVDTSISAGRNAWRQKFGVNPPPPRRNHRTPTRGPRSNGFIRPVSSNNVADFKTMPSVFPDIKPCRRPSMGRCCSTCLPRSRDEYYDRELTEAQGIKDVLYLDTRDRQNGVLTRAFYRLSYIVCRDVSHRYPDVIKPVLQSTRVKESIEKCVSEELKYSDPDSRTLHERLRTYEARASALLTFMKAKISKSLIRATGWFLHHMLGRILSTIQVHNGQMTMVKQASKSGIPLVFLPMHRSHLDYILLTFILWTYDIRAPYVAAGDNLNIPLFGRILKGLGGFFIRRKLDETSGKKDHIYRAVLHSYMAALLERSAFMEFFIEGGRSRTGKACKPKGGLLSVVVDTHIEGHCPDLKVVPVSISYEKILDGDFMREQMGDPKIKESFMGTLRALWRVFSSSYGSVRVDFAQPFSLQEYLDTVSRSSSLLNSSQNGRSPPNGLCRVGSGSSLYGTDVVVEDQRHMVNQLASHVIHTCVTTTAPMSTHLLAFLLLTKYRQGAPLSKIVRSFDWLRGEIVNHGRDVGFVGRSEDVVVYAAAILGRQLIQIETLANDSERQTNNNIANVCLNPSITLPNVLELSYYSNVCTSVFLLESVLACSLASVCDIDLRVWQRQGHEMVVTKNEILENAVLLCNYLQYDFTFVPPCADLEVELSFALEKLVDADILTSAEEDISHEEGEDREYARRVARSFEDDDSYGGEWAEEEYTVNLSEDATREQFVFLRHVLGPIIETYWIVAFSLYSLLESDMPEAQFVKEVHNFALERVRKGLASYAESISMDGLHNAMKCFLHTKVTQVYFDSEGNKLIGLHEKHNARDRLDGFVDSLASFRV